MNKLKKFKKEKNKLITESEIRDCGIGIKCNEKRMRRESCTSKKMG